MKTRIISALFLSQVFCYATNEPLDPYIVKIDGPTDLGIGYTGTYSAPADKGRPPYVYSWRGDKGTVPESTSATNTFKATTVGGGSITASIVDQDGKKDSKDKAITVHEEVEIAMSGAGSLEEQLQNKALVGAVANSADVQETITVSKEVTWSVEVGVTYEMPIMVLAKLGASVKVSRTQKDTLTIPIVAPPHTKIVATLVPTVLVTSGTWKIWTVGLSQQGEWENRSNEAYTVTFEQSAL